MSEQSASEQKKEDWMNSKWRPMMGWMYMLVCMFDMIVFPVLWSLLQTVTHTPITQWNPLTLQGAGLFHIAMGAVLGIAAFGRTQEKLNGANNGGAQIPATGSPSGSTTFGAPSTGGFSSPSTSFGSAPLGGNSASSFGGGGFGSTSPAPAPTTGFAGGFNSTPAVNAKGQKVVPQDDFPPL
jgi:Holin of 3TMs, for gene-transfer release